MKETVLEKLKVLAESAKYDVSCASSGTVTAQASCGRGGQRGGWRGHLPLLCRPTGGASRC